MGVTSSLSSSMEEEMGTLVALYRSVVVAPVCGVDVVVVASYENTVALLVLLMV